MTTLAERLKRQALSEGFDAAAICAPDSIPQAPRQLAHFLDRHYHGQMTWLESRAKWRADPLALWPSVRSIIMLAHAYGPDDDPLAVLGQPDRGAISVHARARDYHVIVKRMLKRLGQWLIAASPGTQIKVFVDTAPVMEKPLANAAGLGWQGKHTNLVSRQLGNWFFLGAIFTDLMLDRDSPERDHCGNCRRCLDICPTNAFPAPYLLDARRCISYLTIEHRGPIPDSLRPALGNRIYGCDDCLAVCPWNKFAVRAREVGYQGNAEPPDLAQLATLDDAGFRARFKGSPIRRIGRARLVRNVLYAIGNSGLKRLRGAAQRLTTDPDAAVADAAHWALARLPADR